MFSYGQIDTINLPKHQRLQVDMFINVRGKWCPEEAISGSIYPCNYRYLRHAV
jgi:hypothetical protein